MRSCTPAYSSKMNNTESHSLPYSVQLPKVMFLLHSVFYLVFTPINFKISNQPGDDPGNVSTCWTTSYSSNFSKITMLMVSNHVIQ